MYGSYYKMVKKKGTKEVQTCPLDTHKHTHTHTYTHRSETQLTQVNARIIKNQGRVIRT